MKCIHTRISPLRAVPTRETRAKAPERPPPRPSGGSAAAPSSFGAYGSRSFRTQIAAFMQVKRPEMPTISDDSHLARAETPFYLRL